MELPNRCSSDAIVTSKQPPIPGLEQTSRGALLVEIATWASLLPLGLVLAGNGQQRHSAVVWRHLVPF
jgi:hypothetical protein